MSDVKPNQKKKSFRLEDELAYRFELQAKKLRISEVKLVSRYIEEGLRRDENQLTLDDEIKMSNIKK